MGSHEAADGFVLVYVGRYERLKFLLLPPGHTMWAEGQYRVLAMASQMLRRMRRGVDPYEVTAGINPYPEEFMVLVTGICEPYRAHESNPEAHTRQFAGVSPKRWGSTDQRTPP